MPGRCSSKPRRYVRRYDGSRAVVGSFNFDPRSAELNTGMGFVVDSPTLAGRIHAVFETGVPRVAYEVRLDPGRRLEWVD